MKYERRKKRRVVNLTTYKKNLTYPLSILLNFSSGQSFGLTVQQVRCLQDAGTISSVFTSIGSGYLMGNSSVAVKLKKYTLKKVQGIL